MYKTNSMFAFIAIILLVGIPLRSAFTVNEVKCHVCKAVVNEMEEVVAKVDPAKKIEVSGFRLDADGNAVGKTVPMSKSETYLSEVMETICDKMDDYVRVTYKKSGKFGLMKIIVNGNMNPESSLVDFVQDGDLNKSLGHYCLEFLEIHEDIVLKHFQAETLADHLDIRICSEDAHYCSDAPVQDDYEFDDKDEL